MSAIEASASGPIDVLVLELEGERMDGSLVEAVLDLVARGTVTVLDALVVRRDADGHVEELEVTALPAPDGGVVGLASLRSGLVDGDDDLADAGRVLEPAKAGLVLVYENTWARPFVTAALAAGAEVVASQRITADVVNDALAALGDDES